MVLLAGRVLLGGAVLGESFFEAVVFCVFRVFEIGGVEGFCVDVLGAGCGEGFVLLLARHEG